MAEIFIPLFGEGTPAWRPVDARQVGEGLFEIPNSAKDDPEENWAFQPGETVRCEKRSLSDGEPVWTAVELVRRAG